MTEKDAQIFNIYNIQLIKRLQYFPYDNNV